MEQEKEWQLGVGSNVGRVKQVSESSNQMGLQFPKQSGVERSDCLASSEEREKGFHLLLRTLAKATDEELIDALCLPSALLQK